jgi:hypothetical protein
VPGEHERRGGQRERADAWVEMNVGTAAGAITLADRAMPGTDIAISSR